ncbi:DUF2306 domain-containing protein [Nocardioides sp. WS12]|uniref:DUF2306 domain-containing protein n=1 Tax=Nocardioides sp. WS12 TaxID=2486272 RepID=UPI0015FBBB98|nr:DUF2306 domain-containing protein [Nocardioides sp. WS12]
MSTTARKRASLLGWGAITALAVLYGPMAIEYMWRFFNPDAPQLWNHTFGAIVDHDEVYGPGSIHAEKAVDYSENRYVLLLHTSAGGIAIVLFAAQFSARVRRNLARHRAIGRSAIAIALIGMVGAMGYLLAVGPEGIFDGPGFYLQLWALALGTTIGVTLGLAAAVKRQIAMHQALMAYAFALLLTAPLLRVGYLLLGNLWPETTQLETNLAGAAFLATWAPLGAFLAARALDTRQRRTSAIGPLPGRALDIGVLAAAVVATAVLAGRYAAAFDGLDRVTTTGLIGAAAGIAIAVTNHVAARRAGNSLAAEEWRVIGLSLLAGAPTGVVLWALYDLPFTTYDAYVGMLLTAPALALSVGFLVVVWRRRVVRRSANLPTANVPTAA